MVDVVKDAEELAQLTANVAAQNPNLITDLERFYEAKKAEFEAWAKSQTGYAPQVQPAPQVSTEKSQADVIAELQTIVQGLQRQLSQATAANNGTVVMEGGEPVPHNLFLDDGTVVKNHPGLATHYSVPVAATATSDATEVVRKVVAAYPA